MGTAIEWITLCVSYKTVPMPNVKAKSVVAKWPSGGSSIFSVFDCVQLFWMTMSSPSLPPSPQYSLFLERVELINGFTTIVHYLDLIQTHFSFRQRNLDLVSVCVLHSFKCWLDRLLVASCLETIDFCRFYSPNISNQWESWKNREKRPTKNIIIHVAI